VCGLPHRGQTAGCGGCGLPHRRKTRAQSVGRATIDVLVTLDFRNRYARREDKLGRLHRVRGGSDILL